MKYNFVLDENIIYFAVKCVDEHENPDATSAELLLLIARNCHTVTTTPELYRRYWKHLEKLKSAPPQGIPPILFINQFLRNADKLRFDNRDLPELPNNAKFPREDIHVAGAALLSGGHLVTGDRPLRDAINAQSSLFSEALSPQEALALAQEQ